jgi:hypothetical protein
LSSGRQTGRRRAPKLAPLRFGNDRFEDDFMLRKTVSALAIAIAVSASAVAADKAFSPYVDGHGGISLPKDFRTGWTHLGSWVIDQEGAPGQGFHDVYARPSAAAAYRKTGHWPDGATLVKEIRAVEHGVKTTGTGVWAGDNKVWFVMVKDSKGRFADNASWGNGWGWALFDAKAPGKNASTDFHKDCETCHVPAKATDWVFVEGYPTLRH